MEHSDRCYYCGVRQPSVGMIIVSHPTEGEMLFCNWAHLGTYATDQLHKQKDANGN